MTVIPNSGIYNFNRKKCQKQTMPYNLPTRKNEKQNPNSNLHLFYLIAMSERFFKNGEGKRKTYFEYLPCQNLLQALYQCGLS